MSAWVVVDLGFGDSGKGTITDFLVRETGARVVVRWNGGAQAGHTVVTDDGRVHTFSQFGAGSFVPGVETFLSERMVIHPTAMLVEARYLERVDVRDALSRVRIAERARVITPWHQSANRARESARGAGRHGTCGVGFGEAVRDALESDDVVRAGDLREITRLRAKAERARARVWASLSEERAALGEAHAELAIFGDRELVARWCEAAAQLASNVVADDALDAVLRDERDVVLEGAQGVLLDQRFGFHPHTTWSDCTARGARELLAQHGHRDETTVLGVLRTYPTRHGEGPFPTEDRGLRLPEPHNDARGWQGTFRVGHPDLVLARYAARVCGGVDALAITHLDRTAALDRVATSYEWADDRELFVHDAHGRAIDLREGDLDHQARLGRALREVTPRYEPLDGSPMELLGVPIAITSSGPTASAKRWRR
ncbi:adenylosuccinate synthetase [Sandaracinus amylolyticus]|uniref:adenylosuccinate synthetase n=1 Tax=Sandaracinus amylolyticus TaxID=927083 RepID=UPI001F2A1B62|nr:adenylosuccinate synthetase [Sandaracinus amylolyticus]UJR86770.1 Hypothetical protein I5071_88710 [Sandaracinus amylolyticus]